MSSSLPILRVLMVSRWAHNPYQILLKAALESQAVEVTEVAPSDLFRLNVRRYDLIHLQNVRPYLTAGRFVVCVVRLVLLAAWLRIARRKTLLVWTAHDLEHPDHRHPILDRLLTRLLVRLANAVIVHDASALYELAKVASSVREKAHVVPHGSYVGYYPDELDQANAREALRVSDDAVVFLVFGWIRRYKNVDELLRVFRQVECPGARLIIAGAAATSYGQELITLAASDTRVHLHLAAVPDNDVQVFMNASDVVVLPYSRVLTSGAAVLGQSFGKACIVPLGPGVGASIPQGGAFLYDPASEEGLASALQAAIEQRAQLRSMGQLNRAHIAAYRWRDVAAATVQVYESVVCGQRPSSSAA